MTRDEFLKQMQSDFKRRVRPSEERSYEGWLWTLSEWVWKNLNEELASTRRTADARRRTSS